MYIHCMLSKHIHYHVPPSQPLVGEKPFETIEDLVQDGLITLYMEVNNVEDYLKSARETMQRSPCKLSTSQVYMKQTNRSV